MLLFLEDLLFVDVLLLVAEPLVALQFALIMLTELARNWRSPFAELLD